MVNLSHVWYPQPSLWHYTLDARHFILAPLPSTLCMYVAFYHSAIVLVQLRWLSHDFAPSPQMSHTSLFIETQWFRSGSKSAPLQILGAKFKIRNTGYICIRHDGFRWCLYFGIALHCFFQIECSLCLDNFEVVYYQKSYVFQILTQLIISGHRKFVLRDTFWH